MIIYRIHGVLGHSLDTEILSRDADCHRELIDRLQKLFVKLRADFDGCEIEVGVTEDVSIEELKRCPACGNRDATRI